MIGQLHRLTAAVDVEALDDRQAVDLFAEVLGALQTSDRNNLG